MLHSFLLRLATFFGAGKLPKAPGTWGSLAALPFAALLMWAGPFVYMVACILMLPLSIFSAEIYERVHGGHDSSEIVIDEVIGMWIAIIWLPFTWQTFVIGFLLFRLLDVTKPWPISYLDRKVQGGVGVVVDDVLAGLIVNIVLQIVYQKTAWLGVQLISEAGLISSREERIKSVLKILREKKWSIGFGESCTGGLLSGAVARIAGVSDVYQGSLVTYSYQAKADLLGVSLQTLNLVGAVSEDVATQMVRGVCERLKVSCAVAITGIAGPSGGTADKPVGTVWVAVRGPQFEMASKQVFTGDRASIQDQSVDWALDLLLERLRKV